MPPIKGGPHCRLSSPNGGGSILTTSAPISASSVVQTGPERIRERSTIKRSSSGWLACDFMYFRLPAPVDDAKAYQLSGSSTAGFTASPLKRATKRYCGAEGRLESARGLG